jgi:hypothetical protein
VLFRFARRLLLLPVALLALLALPSAASPAGQIVLYGAPSGSHLILYASPNRIVATGLMAATHPRGCHLSANRMKAVCRVSGASSVELDMGPAGDFVEVADPSPLPIVAYLGAGSDKMVGNDEVDTCYSEGSTRNRCVGGGGNDVCITGVRNSDCVGGPGDDYCRHQFGSDGCWGGPGNDVCVMGPGQDGCHGDAGNDHLYGGANPDQLYGGTGIDYCDGGPGPGKSHSCDIGPRH